MTDAECVSLLRFALPRLQLRWEGFRRVRRQVCKRIGRRLVELGLPDAEAYRAFLERHPDEWRVLDGLCRIPISRFYRDRAVFGFLVDDVLPALARRFGSGGELRCWSAGCASGEEPYALSIAWELALRERWPGLRLRILASDVDAHLLGRAREGRYSRSSLKELPEAWIARAFEREGDLYRLRDTFRERVEWLEQDVREVMPEAPLHLVLCRNLVFTYFEPALQREVLARIAARIPEGGALVIGLHESLPPEAPDFVPWENGRAVYRRVSPGLSSR